MGTALHMLIMQGGFSFYQTSERRKNVHNHKYIMSLYRSCLFHPMVGVEGLMNYLIYPCKTMRITQNYLGKTSHYPHTTGLPSDYPIDEGCEDTGKDKIYCPCDKMKVRRIYGVGTGGTNTLWLESTDKTDFADGTLDYFTMMITHPDDADLKNIRVGDVFTRGQAITKEGRDGATANHLHISAGKGKFKGNGWIKNTKGKYVLNCTKGAYKPERLFYINPEFTDVISTGGITFREKPQEYTAGYYKVTASVLNVRKGAGTEYKKNGSLIKGKKIKITVVKGEWGKISDGRWVSLKYCRKVQVI
jgi:hypothetical protein